MSDSILLTRVSGEDEYLLSGCSSSAESTVNAASRGLGVCAEWRNAAPFPSVYLCGKRLFAKARLPAAFQGESQERGKSQSPSLACLFASLFCTYRKVKEPSPLVGAS